MDLATRNLLLGAAIALVSTLLSTGLAYFLQQRDARRKRKWEIEDRKYNEQRQIYLHRLDQIEEYARIVVRSELEIREGIKDLLIGRADNLDLETIQPLFENAHALGMVQALNDPDVHKAFSELIDMAYRYGPLILEIRTQIKNNKLDRDTVRDKFKELLAKRPSESEAFGRLVARLDTLRANYEPLVPK
jgi:hypothetical protein